MPPRDANLLHRILFQHVAAAGGFEAARSLIGGLDPSVARRNVQALEEELGLILYERRPFRLTADGRHLIEFDRPLLEKLGQVSEHLKRKSGPRLRVGITGSAAKQFLFPTMAAWLAHPERAAIESCFGSMRELGGDLESGELDLLITTLAGDPPAGFASHHLATFRLVLIVPADSPVRSAEEFWRPDAQLGCLIAPPADDAVMQTFEHGLERGGLHWPTRLTCDSPSRWPTT
jgi:DNA-binding transcriptional LysR family regulator